MPEPDPANLGELLALIERWCRMNLQRRPREVGLRWGNGRPTTWLPLAEVQAEAQAVAAPTPPAEQPFVPSPFQEAVLDALEGKALRVDALGAAVGDRGRLYKPGGLKELQAQGWVAYHTRRGYFRPDAPPEDLAPPESPQR